MRILSFDIGSDSIKALELDARFGRIELTDYLLERVVEPSLEKVTTALDSDDGAVPVEAPAGATVVAPDALPSRRILSEGQVAAIKRIVGEKALKFDKIIINLPRGLTTTRLLTFPTKDRKVIQRSIVFELEDEIPVNLNETIYDFSVLQSQGNSSTVFTAIVMKKDLVALLSELQMIGLDPDVVTTEGWSMSQLLHKSILPELEGAPVCVVNLGSRHTVLHMMVAQNPVITHSINAAGNSITQAIATNYGLTFEQAEKAKVEGGFLLTQAHLSGAVQTDPITPEQKKFAQAISDSLNPVVREIKQTLMSFKSQYHMNPKAIFLTGGTSLLPNLPAYLEEALQMPVQTLHYGEKVVGPSLQLSDATEAQFSTAMGLALSGAKSGKSNIINFRKDLFEKKGGMGSFSLQAFAKPLKYMVASLAFIYANLLVQYMVLSSRSEKQSLALERSVRNVLGSSVSKSSLATYINSPSSLKNAVNKEIAKYKPVVAAPAKKPASAFDVLHKVSSSMPRDITLDISQFVVKDSQLTLKGVLSQAADTDKVAKSLEDTKILSGIVKGKTEEDPKTKKVTFDLTAKIGEATP